MAANSHMSITAACGAAVLTAAATLSAVDPTRFAAQVDLVALDVCVRDAAGRFVPDLSASDFVVLENGKPQQLTFMAPADGVPLTVVLLIDRSGSMHGTKLEYALDAANEFAALLGPDDRLEIIGFNDQAQRLHAFGDDVRKVPAALRPLWAVGSTAMYDALLVGVNALQRARGGQLPDTREAIVLLSDGEDVSSRVDFQEAQGALRRSGAIVYAVSLRVGLDGRWLGPNWPMLAVARDSGGRAAGVEAHELADLYREINTELRHMYRLGYVSADERRDGAWRNVAVRLRSREAHIRTRAGYYAPRSPGAATKTR